MICTDYEKTRQADGSVVLKTACTECGREFESEPLDPEKVARVELGEHVQYVFPDMSSADRELFFLSGTCQRCWDSMFGVDEGWGSDK